MVVGSHTSTSNTPKFLLKQDNKMIENTYDNKSSEIQNDSARPERFEEILENIK